MTSTVAVRMYNVGFGDAFVVTVDHGGQMWRMLVDCGVHSQGRARPIEEAVDAIIADLTTASRDGQPHLDVVVATHHHADHILGFAEEAWSRVVVDEVWVPFVEDATDEDARKLREGQHAAAARITALVEGRRPASGRLPTALRVAQLLAANSSGNATATDRLLGRNGRGFRGPHRVRYVPSTHPAENTVATAHPAVIAHVLGPSRDPATLKRMDPPASARWLSLDDPALDAVPAAGRPLLFNDVYAVTDPATLDAALVAATAQLDLDDLADDESLLAAASILENAVNNTSVFFVLDVEGTGLLFPGDAQQGAWDHVLDDPAARALVAGVAFVKIAHHGSGNATPRRFVESVLPDGRFAMLPWGLVKRWQDSIPQQRLMAALEAHRHTVVHADSPQPVAGRVTVHDDLWSEMVFDLA